MNISAKKSPDVRTFKGVTDLKAHLDYCEHPARTEENLNFGLPGQTEPFYCLQSQFGLTLFKRLLDFSQQYLI